MTEPSIRRVLGIDVASRSWKDVGVAVVESTTSGWRRVTVDEFSEPTGRTAQSLADAIDALARRLECDAVILDGPQGWRDPAAADRPGVGRACEYSTRTQGKVGVFGSCYPRPQLSWVQVSTDTFAALLRKQGVALANAAPLPYARPPGGYWVMECFPTQTWRSLAIRPLPGKSRTASAGVEVWARALWRCLQLPPPVPPLSHDQLQAVVACLPAAAALGGPLRPRVHGEAARSVSLPVDHSIEGYIWDVERESTAEWVDPGAGVVTEPGLRDEEDAPDARSCTFLPDERSDLFDDLVAKGALLFEELVEVANHGAMAEGIDYAYFVATLYGEPSFRDVAERNFQNATDVNTTLLLAQRITEAAGRRCVSRNGCSIDAGMDTFIWNQDANRPENAWRNTWMPVPYSRAEWLAVFPDDQRAVRTKDGLQRQRPTRSRRAKRKQPVQ